MLNSMILFILDIWQHKPAPLEGFNKFKINKKNFLIFHRSGLALEKYLLKVQSRVNMDEKYLKGEIHIMMLRLINNIEAQ